MRHPTSATANRAGPTADAEPLPTSGGLVAHFRQEFWQPTETFILNYLSGLITWRPTVFTCLPRNLDRVRLPVVVVPEAQQDSGPGLPSLARELSTRQMQLVHAHFANDAYHALVAIRSTGLPLVVSCYGFDVSRLLSESPHWHERLLEVFEQATAVLAEGPAMQRRLVDLGCPDHKVKLQHIALKVTQYSFRERSWDGRRPLRVLLCGRLVEKKGFAQAVAALGMVGRPFEVCLIGDGPERESIAAALRAAPTLRAEWLGQTPHAAVLDRLQWADILLQPSVTAADGDSEGGAPTILLEAQAAGVLVVASDHADLPYVCAGEHAWLAPAGDVAGLKMVIQRCLSERLSWPDASRAGRQHVVSKHDLDSQVPRLERLYNAAVHGVTNEASGAVPAQASVPRELPA